MKEWTGMTGLPRNKPTRSTIEAKNMVGTKVEIEVIAYKPCSRQQLTFWPRCLRFCVSF
jgi:hypothetical protein